MPAVTFSDDDHIRRSRSTVLISVESAALCCNSRLGTNSISRMNVLHGHFIIFRCANWDHVSCPPKV